MVGGLAAYLVPALMRRITRDEQGAAAIQEAASLPAGAGKPMIAVGVRKLVSDYAGPLLRVQRAEDNATLDVPALANGLPDDAAAIAWADGAELRVAIAYDQSGNGFHFQPETWAAMPLYDPAGLYGTSSKYGASNALVFDGWFEVAAKMRHIKWARWASGVTANRTSISVFDVIDPKSALYNATYWNFTATQGNSAGILGMGTSAGLGGLYASGFSDDMTNRYVRQNMQTMGLTSSVEANKVHLDGQIISLPPKGSTEIISGTLGASASGLTGANDFVDSSNRLAFVVYPTALPDAEAMAVRKALDEIFGIMAADGNQIVLSGDSILFGGTVIDSLQNRTVTREIRSSLVGNPALYSMALSSQLLTGEGGMAAMAATREDLLAVEGDYSKRILVIQIGSNDMGIHGGNAGFATTLYAALTSYIAERRAAGFTHILVSTLLPAASTTSGQHNVEYLAYNALVRANAAGADGVLDLASHPVMGSFENAGNRLYYQDSLHPTGLGNSLVATTGDAVEGLPVNYAEAINRLLAAGA